MNKLTEITPAAMRWMRDKKKGRSSNIIAKMSQSQAERDADAVSKWLSSNRYDSDAVFLADDPVMATMSLLKKQREFADWDEERLKAAVMHDEQQQGAEDMALESVISQAVKNGINSAMLEAKKKDPKSARDNKKSHDKVGSLRAKEKDKDKAKKDLKKGNLHEKPVRKITRSELAEGVRKALRMALKENGMAGGTMPAPGMSSGPSMSAPTQEGLSGKGSSVPSVEELQAALDKQGGWDMNLQGPDFLAFSYALEVAGLGNPDLNSGQGMHTALIALSNPPSPDQLPDSIDDEEIDNPHSHLNKTLNSWEVRYGNQGKKIQDHARKLASDIIATLTSGSVKDSM